MPPINCCEKLREWIRISCHCLFRRILCCVCFAPQGCENNDPSGHEERDEDEQEKQSDDEGASSEGHS